MNHLNYEQDRKFFVVGIGASAGGLRALEEFFEHMPTDSGAAFVVIQHLSRKTYPHGNLPGYGGHGITA